MPATATGVLVAEPGRLHPGNERLDRLARALWTTAPADPRLGRRTGAYGRAVLTAIGRSAKNVEVAELRHRSAKVIGRKLRAVYDATGDEAALDPILQAIPPPLVDHVNQGLDRILTSQEQRRGGHPRGLMRAMRRVGKRPSASRKRRPQESDR